MATNSEAHLFYKPKAFISSTIRSLEDIRSCTDVFLQAFDIEPIRSEVPSFPETELKHPHDICLDNVKACDFFIGIIGERYGSLYDGNDYPKYKNTLSITEVEFKIAFEEMKMPALFLVKKEVLEAKRWYYSEKDNGVHEWLDEIEKRFHLKVDSLKLFSFIEWSSSVALKSEFRSPQDIHEALVDKLPYLYRNLMSKMSKFDIPRPGVTIVRTLVPREYQQRAENTKAIQRMISAWTDLTNPDKFVRIRAYRVFTALIRNNMFEYSYSYESDLDSYLGQRKRIFHTDTSTESIHPKVWLQSLPHEKVISDSNRLINKHLAKEDQYVRVLIIQNADKCLKSPEWL